MKKIIIFGCIVFIIALAAATGARIVLSPQPEEEVGSDRALESREEVPSEATPHAPALESGQRNDEQVAAIEAKMPAAPEPLIPQPKIETHSPPSVEDLVASPVRVAESQPRENEQPVTAQYDQLAKILGSMQAKDAAEIMVHLTDEQVEGILRSLGVRQVAALLPMMPVKRAAALSQRLLDNPEENR